MRTAYSYERISSRRQVNGNGLDRQAATANRYLAAHPDLTLDTSLTLSDKGQSGFHGHNLTKGHLGAFLKAVEVGTVKAGSVLIVESVDRLSRQEPLEALELVKQIIDAGISIVTATDGQEYSRESIRQNPAQLFVLLGIMMRAHEESRRKSELAKSAHDAARERRDGSKIFGMCPSWIDRQDKGFTLNPTKAATLREIIRLSLSGMGPNVIIGQLNQKKTPVFSARKTEGFWDYATVSRMLQSRTLIGEFQPKIDGKPQGQPIKSYYPAVCTEAEFYALQSGFATRRRVTKGRVSHSINNLFGTLLKDADGASYTVLHNNPGSPAMRMVSMNCVRKVTPYVSFPYGTFERAFLAWVKEVKLIEHQQTPQTERLARELSDLDQKITATEGSIAAFTGGSFDSGLKILAQLNSQKQAKVKELESEKARSHAPSYSTSSIAALADTMNSLPADERLECRAQIKQAIASVVRTVKVQILKDAATRTAVAAVEFLDGSTRYLSIGSDGQGHSYTILRRWPEMGETLPSFDSRPLTKAS